MKRWELQMIGTMMFITVLLTAIFLSSGVMRLNNLF